MFAKKKIAAAPATPEKCRNAEMQKTPPPPPLPPPRQCASYYRSDLLAKYGYHIPPQTWSELEKMAFRIQEAERAAGDKTFWGFVWPGAADEYLTCLALEWQASEGGGMIIESNRTISVNNENAIRAWQRAAHWIKLDIASRRYCL